MYKRAYAIRLKPGTSEETVAELIRVLEEAPQHIPGMPLSMVRRALPPSRYDLIWDNAFKHLACYRNYLSHPYHCNVIDHFMYRESPAAVIADSLCLRWTEADEDLQEGDAEMQSTVGGHDGPLYLVEHIEVQPGRTGEYLAALEQDYLPMLSSFGISRVSCLRSPDGSGEDELVLTWKLADWQTFVNFRAFFQFENEPAATDLVARLNALRRGGRRRLMVPVAPD
jgi:Stress responsive A/B Barrel Domain